MTARSQNVPGLAGAFAEGMSLADKAGLQQDALLEVLSLGAINNPMFALKGPTMQKRAFPPAFPLKHQQKDMRLALQLGCANYVLSKPECVAAAISTMCATC